MCGIAGYIVLGSQTPTKEDVTKLFTSIEDRGKDAAGYAFIKDNEINIYKNPIKMTELVQTPEWQKLELPPILIGHTRNATQGDCKINTNNHPLISDSGRFALIHNGIIYNENSLGIDTDTVDSLAILKAWEQTNYDPLETTKLLQGWFACAILDKENADIVHFFRRSSPLTLIINQTNHILYFNSIKTNMNFLEEYVQKQYFGFLLKDANSHYIEIPDDTYFMIDKTKGLLNQATLPKVVINYQQRAKHWGATQGNSKAYASSTNKRYNHYYNEYYGNGRYAEDYYDEELTRIFPPQRDAIFMSKIETVNQCLTQSEYQLQICEACDNITTVNMTQNNVCDWCLTEITIEERT